MGRVNRFEGDFGKNVSVSQETATESADEVMNRRMSELLETVSESLDTASEKGKKSLRLLIQTFDKAQSDHLSGTASIQDVVSSILDIEKKMKGATAKNIYSNLIKREHQIASTLNSVYKQKLDEFEVQAQDGALDLQEIREWSAGIARDFSTSEREMMGDEYDAHVKPSREWFEKEGNKRVSEIILLQSEAAA
ncbi:MAG: hypothetical protein ACPGO5_02590 [Patescibacteria group bacterium]